MKSKPTYQELENELEAIRLSNDLIEKSPIVRFEWKNQKNWPVEYVSENVKSIFGYTAEDFITGKIVYSEIIFPEDIERVENEVSSQSKTGFYSIEHQPYRIIDKAGKTKWINDITLIRRNENKEITHFEGIIIDITKQKETERELVESELRWKFAVEGNSDGLWDWNLITDDVFFSTQWKKMLGFSENEIQGSIQEWDKRVHPDDKKKVYEEIEKHKNGETDCYRSEHRVLCKDNSYKWILDRGRIISYTSDNKPERMIGTHSDITKSKKAAESLAQFKEIIESTSGHMSFIDTNYVYREVNNSYLIAHSKKREEVVGHTIADILGNEVFENVIKDKIDACFSGETVKYESWFDFVGIGKRYMEVSYYPYSDGRNIISSVIVDSHDITERKKAEQALKESNAHYRQLFNMLPYGGELINSKGEIVDCSMNTTKLLGYDKDEIIGKHITEFVDEDTIKHFKRYFPLLLKGKTLSLEGRLMHKSGRKINVLRSAQPILNSKNTVTSVLIISTDITARKKAEQALKIENDRFKSILDTSPSGIYIVDKQFNIEYLNPVIEKEFGQINGRKCYSYFHDLTKPCDSCKNKEVFAGKSVRREWFSKKNNKYYELFDTPLENPDGTVSKFEILFDITDRKKAVQTELREKKRFQKTIDAIDAAVYVADMQTYELLFLNKYSKKLFGDKIGQKCYSVLQKGRIKPCEFCTNHLLLDKNGNPKKPYMWEFQNTITKRWYQCRDQAIQWTDGRLVRLEIASDITERKQEEETLKASEDRLSKTIIAANDGMWDWDLITNKVYFDPKYYEMAGYAVDEFPYEFDEFQKRIYPDDVENVMAQAQRHIEGKIARFNVEFRFKKKSGDWLWIMGRGIIVERDEKNNPIRFIGTHSDITERKKAEQALKESNASKEKIFSIIAHDLRSPFHSMLGFAKLLESDFDKFDIGKRKKYINIIQKGLKETSDLLENLLYWSRSQRGTIDLNPESINLHLFFNETSRLLRLSANNKLIKLTNEIPEHISVEADKDMLSTIIRNLISNAIKFTLKGGEIVIRAQLTKENNKFVEISVQDTGVGIPNEIQPTLFDIGKSTSTKGTEKENGTGLGLILCKEFVEKHGGTISVESKIDEGSIFNFTIPFCIND